MDARGIIGNYVIERELGRGGMGVVYAAKHRVLGRPAAIKLLLANTIEHRDRVERFFNEARAAMAIDHPGVVKIYDVGVAADDRAYIAMELLDGHSLASRLEHGPLPLRVAVDFARQIADALAAAHAAGVIHRDLKPDNIIVLGDANRLKLVDFGIAKLAGPVSVRTATGAVIGTPLYMSPEQCEGLREVDARTDLYSLGCVMFAMLTGRPPFENAGTGGLIGAHLHLAPPSLRSRCPTASAALEAVVQCLLAKSRDHRFLGARAVTAALANPEVTTLVGPPNVAPTAELAPPATYPQPLSAPPTSESPQPRSGPPTSVLSAQPPSGPPTSAPSFVPPQPSRSPTRAKAAPAVAAHVPGGETVDTISSRLYAPPPPAAPGGRRARAIAIVGASCAATAIIAILATRSCAGTTTSPPVAAADAGLDRAVAIASDAQAGLPGDAGDTLTLADLQIASRSKQTGSGEPTEPTPRTGSAKRAAGSGSAARTVARVEPLPEPRRTPEELPVDAGVATPPPPPPEVDERVLFGRGDFSVRGGEATLDKIAQLHRAHPTVTIVITGHAETDEPGVLGKLALARANAVKMQLVNRRVDRDKIRLSSQALITSPADDGSTRRADITFAR